MKTVTEIRITQLENTVLTAMASLMYAEIGFSDVGFADIKATSKLDQKTLKGVIGSLIKKGLVHENRREGEYSFGSTQSLNSDSRNWIYYLSKEVQQLVPDWKQELEEEGYQFLKIVITDSKTKSNNKTKSNMETTTSTIESITGELNNVSEIKSQLFEVHMEPLVTENENYQNPINFATYKKGDFSMSPFGVVGSTYCPQQPIAIFDAVLESLIGLDLPLEKLKYHELKGGSKINFEIPIYRMEFVNAAKVNDITDVYLTIQTGFDGWTKTSAFLMTERLICENGMKAHNSELLLDFRNVKGNAGKIETFTEDLLEMFNITKDFENVMKRMNDYQVSKYQVDQMVKKVFDKDRKDYANWGKRSQNTFDKIHEAIELEFSRTGETAFGLLQGITNYVNHGTRHTNRRDYLMVDSGEWYNRKAQQYAMQMVKA